MEAISGRKTIQEITAEYVIHPIQVSKWKRQLLDGADVAPGNRSTANVSSHPARLAWGLHHETNPPHS